MIKLNQPHEYGLTHQCKYIGKNAVAFAEVALVN